MKLHKKGPDYINEQYQISIKHPKWFDYILISIWAIGWMMLLNITLGLLLHREGTLREFFPNIITLISIASIYFHWIFLILAIYLFIRIKRLDFRIVLFFYFLHVAFSAFLIWAIFSTPVFPGLDPQH
jgi:hypothetical protein